MNSIECILKRRSIRKYQDRIVREEDIKILLESAMAAPSARNQQPWEFYVISNKVVLDQIRGVGRNFDFNSSKTKLFEFYALYSYLCHSFFTRIF